MRNDIAAILFFGPLLLMWVAVCLAGAWRLVKEILKL
jgi:hypothetical protein